LRHADKQRKRKKNLSATAKTSARNHRDFFATRRQTKKTKKKAFCNTKNLSGRKSQGFFCDTQTNIKEKKVIRNHRHLRLRESESSPSPHRLLQQQSELLFHLLEEMTNITEIRKIEHESIGQFWSCLTSMCSRLRQLASSRRLRLSGDGGGSAIVELKDRSDKKCQDRNAQII
jgi:hypothetical protein